MGCGNKVLSILVAEDDDILRGLYLEWLTDIFKATPGVIITLLSNGREILEILKSKKFDISILDMALPGATGLDIYKERRHSLGSIVIASAYADVFSKYLNTEDKCCILNKPFNKNDLLTTLKNIPEVTVNAYKRTDNTGKEYLSI